MNNYDKLKDDIIKILNGDNPSTYPFLASYLKDYLNEIYLILNNSNSHSHIKNTYDDFSNVDLENYFKVILMLVNFNHQYIDNDLYLLYIVLTQMDYNEMMIILKAYTDKDIDINSLYHYLCSIKLFKQHNNIEYNEDFKKCLLNEDKVKLGKISSKMSFNDFKEVYLYYVFGLEEDQARFIVNYYGRYLDKLEKCISDDDRETFSWLKRVVNFYKLDNPSKKEYNFFYKVLGVKIRNNNRDYSLFYHYNNRLKKMYMKSYNNSLLKLDGMTVSNNINGVLVYDAPSDFLLAVHSIEKSKSYSDSLDYESEYVDYSNYAEKWNESGKIGLSTSLIGPSNMSIMPSSFYLGFNNYDVNTLNVVAPFDAFTSNTLYSLFDDYLKDMQKDNLNFLVPSNCILNETRYGYNEMFNYQINLKKPSYLVSFSEVSEYSNVYNAAKSFNIPIVHVDRNKVQREEINKINMKTEMLFSNKNNDPSLILNLICSSMNMMSSSIVGAYEFDRRRPCYLMIDWFNEFLNRFDDKIKSFSDVRLKVIWLNTLKKAYDDELQKYIVAKKVPQYEHLLTTFVLNDKRYVMMGEYLENSYQKLNDNTNKAHY